MSASAARVRHHSAPPPPFALLKSSGPAPLQRTHLGRGRERVELLLAQVGEVRFRGIELRRELHHRDRLRLHGDLIRAGLRGLLEAQQREAFDQADAPQRAALFRLAGRGDDRVAVDPIGIADELERAADGEIQPRVLALENRAERARHQRDKRGAQAEVVPGGVRRAAEQDDASAPPRALDHGGFAVGVFEHHVRLAGVGVVAGRGA